MARSEFGQVVKVEIPKIGVLVPRFCRAVFFDHFLEVSALLILDVVAFVPNSSHRKTTISSR
jgi:hypothetical protein